MSDDITIASVEECHEQCQCQDMASQMESLHPARSPATEDVELSTLMSNRQVH